MSRSQGQWPMGRILWIYGKFSSLPCSWLWRWRILESLFLCRRETWFVGFPVPSELLSCPEFFLQKASHMMVHASWRTSENHASKLHVHVSYNACGVFHRILKARQPHKPLVWSFLWCGNGVSPNASTLSCTPAHTTTHSLPPCLKLTCGEDIVQHVFGGKDCISYYSILYITAWI